MTNDNVRSTTEVLKKIIRTMNNEFRTKYSVELNSTQSSLVNVT